jgi:hypothetical protein
MKGAAGRRAVTVEHLQYKPDGTMKPVVQTEPGMGVPAACQDPAPGENAASAAAPMSLRWGS